MNLLNIGPSVACLKEEIILRFFQVKLLYKHIEERYIRRDFSWKTSPLQRICWNRSLVISRKITSVFQDTRKISGPSRVKKKQGGKNQLQSNMPEHNPLCRSLLITVRAHERTGINRCWSLLKAFNAASQWTLMELAFLESQLDCQGNHITKGCRVEGYRRLLKSSMGMTKLNETGCPRKQFSHLSCLLAGFHSIIETFLQELINFHILGPGELPMLLRIGRFFWVQA